MKILFRLDAAAFIGMGHVYQCLSLAEAFKERSVPFAFAMREYDKEILARVAGVGIDVLPLPSDVEEGKELDCLFVYLEQGGFDGIFIDHHEIGLEYCNKIRKKGYFVASLDTEGKRSFCSDLLINYHIYAQDIDYETASYTESLLGPQYALIRSQFSKEVNGKAKQPKLLVTMGGGYARGEVIKVLNALELLDDGMLKELGVEVVFGPGYPEAENMAAAFSRMPVTFHSDVSDMRALMERTTFAVCGAGSTVYELSRMGLPAITIELHENQNRIARYFARNGISRNLGWFEQVKVDDIAGAVRDWFNAPEELTGRRQKAMALVDGKGAERITEVIIRKIKQCEYQ